MTSPASVASLPSPANPANAAHNVFWLLTERSLKAVGGVAIGVLIARHLGPEDYGRYGAAIGLATLAKEAVMLGLDRIIRRDLAARPAEAGRIVGSSIVFGLALALAAALGLTALAQQFVEDDLTRRLTRVVIWMGIPQAFFACEIWFESAGMTRPLVWTRNAVWLASLGGRVALILANASVLAFAVLALVEWAVTYAAVCWLLRHLHRYDLRFGFDVAQLRAWLYEGRPLMLMAVLTSVADRLMVLLVQKLASAEIEAGYLSAAFRITDIWWSISTLNAAVLLPRIVAMQRADPVRCAQAIQVYSNASFIVGAGTAFAVTLVAPFFVPWAFGKAFAPSALVLAVIFWSGPTIFLSVARAQVLVSRGQIALELPTVAVNAALRLGLAVLLIPRYGAIGAAIAITGAHWLSFCGTLFMSPKLRDASQPQLRAFCALLSPWETFRSLRGFIGAMIRRN